MLSEFENLKTEEVLKVANVSSKCLEASYEERVGDEASINSEFVKNHMEILYFYPIKNEKSLKNKEEALAQYLKTMGDVMDRFE